MLTGYIHSKEQRHKDKQDPDKEKYLNILKHVFKHLHNHFVEVYPKHKTNLLIFLEVKLDNVVLVFCMSCFINRIAQYSTKPLSDENCCI